MTNRPIPDPNDPVERGHRRLMYALMPGGRRLDPQERNAVQGVLYTCAVARDQRDRGLFLDVDELLGGIAAILGHLAADPPITMVEHDSTCHWRVASEYDGAAHCAGCGRAYSLDGVQR